MLTFCLLFLQQQGEWQSLLTVRSPELYGGFSNSVATISDLDQDGKPDLLVGARTSYLTGPLFGAAYVVSGMTGQMLFALGGESYYSLFGYAVSGAGDVDADGFDDLLIGAPLTDNHGLSRGAAYVYSGRTGALIHRFQPAAGNQYSFGQSVSGLGDTNHDGYDDVLVGEPGFLRTGGGGVIWLYSGRDGSVLRTIGDPGQFAVGSAFCVTPDLTGDGDPDIIANIGYNTIALISGATGSEIRRQSVWRSYNAYGVSMATLGDLDRDGWPDYVVGAHSGVNYPGEAFVCSGATGAELFYFAGGVGHEFGDEVAGVGDVDGDGYPDILVAAPDEPWWNEHGAVYLYSGFDGTLLERFFSRKPEAGGVGQSVTGMGDINDDGLADFAIGSAWDNVTTRGAVRIYSLRSYLQLAPKVLSAAAGGTIAFTLDFPDSQAHRAYRIFASSGTGRTRVDGWWLPLARSPLLTALAHNPPPGFQGSSGTLDAAGDAAASLTLAPLEAAAFAGRSIKWTAVTFDAACKVSKFSAAMPLGVEP